jgi:hypothetical protein
VRERAGFRHDGIRAGYVRRAAMFRNRFIPLAAVLTALALPASASADAGAITAVQKVDDSTATATFTASSTFCGANGYCGFFAYARAVPASEPCAVGAGRAVWVSDDVATASGTQTGTDTFPLLDAAPLRLCLFLFQAGDREYAVAETVFDPNVAPAGAAPPSTVPAGSAPLIAAAVPRTSTSSSRRARTLSARTARSQVARALRARYGRAYRSGRSRKTTCRRRSRTVMRCSVSWRYRARRYRGTVTVTSRVNGTFSRRISVRRSRAR